MYSTELSPREWAKRRREALQRDGFVCRDCGCIVSEGLEGGQPTANVHHIESRDESGSDNIENLVTLCPDCHSDRHEESTIAGEIPDTEDLEKFGSPLSEHPNWQGGRTVTSHGYVMVKAPNHPDSHTNGYIYEHRLVAEQELGRRLESDEHVHHENGDKQDNRPENLEVLPRSAHKIEHRSGGSDRTRGHDEPNPTIRCACGCGETLKKYDDWNRDRERLPGHTDYAQATPTQDDVLAVLQERGPLHRSDLSESVDRTLSTTSTILSKLRKQELVEPVGGGEWDAVDDAQRDEPANRTAEA